MFYLGHSAFQCTVADTNTVHHPLDLYYTLHAHSHTLNRHTDGEHSNSFWNSSGTFFSNFGSILSSSYVFYSLTQTLIHVFEPTFITVFSKSIRIFTLLTGKPGEAVLKREKFILWLYFAIQPRHQQSKGGQKTTYIISKLTTSPPPKFLSQICERH